MPKRSTNPSKKHRKGYQLKLSELEASARTKKGWIKRHQHMSHPIKEGFHITDLGPPEDEPSVVDIHKAQTGNEPDPALGIGEGPLDHLASEILAQRSEPREVRRTKEAKTYAKQHRGSDSVYVDPKTGKEHPVSVGSAKAALRVHLKNMGWEETTLKPESVANKKAKPVTYFFDPTDPTRVYVPDFYKLETEWKRSEPQRQRMKQEVDELETGNRVTVHGLEIERNSTGSYNVDIPGVRSEGLTDARKADVFRLIDNYKGLETLEPSLRMHIVRERKDRPKEAEKLKQIRREGLSPDDLPDIPQFHTPEDIYAASGHENVKGFTQGWKAQHEFNEQQRYRRGKQYKAGEYYRGAQLYSSAGEPSARRAPQERSDIGVGANKEYLIKTNRFELLNPEDAKTGRSKVTFSIKSSPTEKPITTDSQEYQNIHDEMNQLVHDAGINSFHIDTYRQTDPVTGETGGYQYRIVTPEGSLINPGQAAQLQVEMDKRFKLAHTDEGPAWSLEGPKWEQVTARSSHNASKLPKGIREEEVVSVDQRKNMYPKRLNYNLGHRNPETGELAEGQRDTLAVKLPKLPKQHESNVAYLHLQERTDAIGFGKNYKPGEKEVNEFLTVGPRYKEAQRRQEAINQHETGDSSEIDKLIREKYPEAGDDKVHKLRDEVIALGAAGGAAGLYTAKKETRHHIIDRVPIIKNYNLLGYDDTKAAYREYFGQKYARGVDRIKRPLTDPLNPSEHGVSFILKPDSYRPIRYRKTAIRTQTIKAREVERERRQMQDVAKARLKIHDASISNPQEMGRLQRINRAMTLRTARGVELKSKDIGFEEKLHNLPEQHEQDYERLMEQHGDTRDFYFDQGGNPIFRERHPAEHPKMKGIYAKSYVRQPAVPTSTDKVLSEKAKSVEEVSNLASADKGMGDYKAALRGKEFTAGEARLPHLGKAGLYVAGGLAVTGAGVYVYDKHKQHEISTGHAQSPSKHIPETVSYPKPSVKVTKKYQVPQNNFTSALDIENKKLPYAWHVGAKKQEKRLRNHKDISGDPYRSGPLVGHLHVEKGEGSFAKSLMYEQPVGLQTPTQGRVYIKGKELPIHVEAGKKERWDQRGPKKYRLSRSNPNKLTQSDREQIAFLYQSSPSEHDKDMIKNLYGSDEGINEILHEIDTDPNEKDRMYRKYDKLYHKGTSVTSNKFYLTPQHQQRLIDAQKKQEERTETSAAGIFNQTIQETGARQEAQRQAREAQKRRNLEEGR